MATDRESTIRKAEKLLKQGRLEAAIAAYVQAVEDQPRDWNAANALGDLYVRAGQVDQAVSQYARVAGHFAREGFLQKAAALYKKIVKIRPRDEGVLLQLADLSEQQGLLADAKSCLSSIAEQRRRRGDRKGSAEIILRLARLDPADVSATLLAARAARELGDTAGAVERFKAAGNELLRRDRTKEALEALAEAAALDPSDAVVRRFLTQIRIEAEQGDRSRQSALTPDDEAELKAVTEALEADSVRWDRDGHDAMMADATGMADAGHARDGETPLHRAERELRAHRYEAARAALATPVADGRVSRDALLALGHALVEDDVDAAFVCVDLASDAAADGEGYDVATSALGAFIRRVPDHVPALMKLIELSVDGGLDATMYAAQAQLADAYLATDRAAEARVIAEDLVAREPWQRTNVDRLRRALVAVGEAEPDRVIADYLSGASPLALAELSREVERDERAEPRPAVPPSHREEPPAEFLDNVEVELDLQELAEPSASNETDAAIENVFDAWLDAQPKAETTTAKHGASEIEPVAADLEAPDGSLTEPVSALEEKSPPAIDAPLPDARVTVGAAEGTPVPSSEVPWTPLQPAGECREPEQVFEGPAAATIAPFMPDVTAAPAEELTGVVPGAEAPTATTEDGRIEEAAPPGHSGEPPAAPDADEGEPEIEAGPEPVPGPPLGFEPVEDLAIDRVPPTSTSSTAAPVLEPVLEPLPAVPPVDADLAALTDVIDAATQEVAPAEIVAHSVEIAGEDIVAAEPLAPASVEPELGVGAEGHAGALAIGEPPEAAHQLVDEGAAAQRPPSAAADDLDRVFEMFRDEAALRGLADMGAQHLKLAAAYRDIGMMDECLGALEVAAHSPRHRFEAASLLAETLRDQGRTREAVEWFERAAEAPAPGIEAVRRLLYELGKTLSDVGESERALAVFLELQADAPDYRDIAARVQRLSSAT